MEIAGVSAVLIFLVFVALAFDMAHGRGEQGIGRAIGAHEAAFVV